MRSRAALLVLALAAVTACGVAPAAGGDLNIIVMPDADGSFPDALMVQCPNGPSFPFGALDNLVPSSDTPAGVEQAMSVFLGGDEGQFWPQTGWRAFPQRGNEILLVALGDGGHLAFITMEGSGGSWRWTGGSAGGPCPLQPVFPNRLSQVEWVLDRSGPPLTASSTQIRVILTERACASGQAMGDRLMDPQIVMTHEAVRLAFAARPLSGDQTCPSNPSVNLTVDLPEPLGTRKVIEGIGIGVNLEDYLD